MGSRPRTGTSTDTPSVRGAGCRASAAAARDACCACSATYAQLAWWGWVGARREPRGLVVHQAVVLGEAGVLLSVRADLMGWELPGGSALEGESGEEAVRREVLEETGLEVAVEGPVGDYCRSGFRPHTARVWRTRAVGGALRTSSETPAVGWFDPLALPDTLFPWYRGPLADGLARASAPLRIDEHQGWRHVLAGFRIDLAMRWRGPAGDLSRPGSRGPGTPAA